MKRSQRGFVANEPLIVLVTFGAMSVLAGWGLASLLNWWPVYGVLAGALVFALGLVSFAIYAKLSSTK